MPILDLRIDPEFAAPGATVTVTPVGEPEGSERRFYLQAAPPTSSLPTLETYAARGLTLADARLRLAGDGQATFVPDVPGVYVVAARDVTTYRFVPSFQGELPQPGDPAVADNETGPFAVGAAVTPQAPEITTYALAYDELSRTIGAGPDAATLTVRVVGNRVVPTSPTLAAVTLTPGAAAASQAATYDAVVLGVLDRMRAVASSADRQFAYHVAMLSRLVVGFNEHIALDEIKVHATIADATTDPLAATNVGGDLALIGQALDDLVARYNAHRVRLVDPVTTNPLHDAADTVNVMVAGSYGTLADAIAYYEHCLSVLQAHATRVQSHDQSTPNRVVDGYFCLLNEPPATLADLARALNGTTGTRWSQSGLLSLYEEHRQRSTLKIHFNGGASPDTSNVVPNAIATVADRIRTANALADAFTRHVRNLDATGAPAGTAYHLPEGKEPRIPQIRASDARSLALLIEEMWLCMEDHLWGGGPLLGYTTETSGDNAGQHPDRAWGGVAMATIPSGEHRPMLLLRLLKAYERALTGVDPESTPSILLGYLSGVMKTIGGFS